MINLGCLQDLAKMPWHLMISTSGCSHLWEFVYTDCSYDLRIFLIHSNELAGRLCVMLQQDVLYFIVIF